MYLLGIVVGMFVLEIIAVSKYKDTHYIDNFYLKGIMLLILFGLLYYSKLVFIPGNNTHLVLTFIYSCIILSELIFSYLYHNKLRKMNKVYDTALNSICILITIYFITQ